MNTNTINNLVTTTYTSSTGVLTSVKWNDGRMRHHTLRFEGNRNGTFVTINWTNVSIFTFDGEEVYFVAKHENGALDEKVMTNIVHVETE